jgi:hypothetical protein
VAERPEGQVQTFNLRLGQVRQERLAIASRRPCDKH